MLYITNVLFIFAFTDRLHVYLNMYHEYGIQGLVVERTLDIGGQFFFFKEYFLKNIQRLLKDIFRAHTLTTFHL